MFLPLFDHVLYVCQAVIKSQRRESKTADQSSDVLHPAPVQAVFEIQLDPGTLALLCQAELSSGITIVVTGFPGQITVRFKCSDKRLERDSVTQRRIDYPA